MANRRDERMKEITDRLQAGLEELFSSDKYTEYLRVMSQFHHYSFNNTLLIALQRPDATLVAGYRAWETKFNRHVMKGEKGIQIIAPAPIREKQEQEKTDPKTGEVVLRDDGQPETEEVTVTIPRFRVSTVFDLSQTDGDPLPELGVEELTASVENYEIFMEAIRSVAPVPVRFDEISSGAKGYYSNTEKEIVLKSDMPELQTMKTAVHETAHAILHDRDIMQAQGIQKDQMTRECEAESVAFTVLSHFGLDTSEYSFPYIGGWSSSHEMKEVRSSLDTIRKTASEIIDGIENSMREQLLERNADRYEIYQIGDESPARDYKFMGLEYTQSHGFAIRKTDYDLIYTAPLAEGETLDSLYEKFNLDHPADFTGHSVSVSDVILIHQNGEDHAFYVDSFGFSEIPEFLEERQSEAVIEESVPEPEKPFIDHFYVIEDLNVKGPLALKRYESLEDAIAAYYALPNDKLKALGIQNTNPLPGSLDFIQCQNGIDTATLDYTAVEVWNNPEVQAVHAEIELALALHDAEIAYEIGDRYFMIQTTADGFDYSLYDHDYHLIDGGVLDGNEPGEPAKTMEEAVHEVLKEAGLSFEDARVLPYEGFMEHVHSAETVISEPDAARETTELSKAEKLAADIDQFAYDYDYYEYMDSVEDREAALRNLTADLQSGDVAGVRDYLKGIIEECDIPGDAAKAAELLGRLDQLHPVKEATLTYFAAECMEFPVLGEYTETETLQEAIKLYDAIPADRMNGGKGIGFNLNDGSEYAGGYPLVQGGKVATDAIDLVEHYRESPLVQRAVEEAKRYFPDARETEYQPREEQAPEPVVEQKTVETNPVKEEHKQPEAPEKRAVEPDKKASEQRTGSKKESVLKALREHQAQIKDREKQTPVKGREHKKEEQSL